MRFIRKVLGLLYAIVLYALPSTRNALRHITKETFQRAAQNAPRDRTCYLMVGFSKSGKTKWLQQRRLYGFTVNSQELHNTLSSWIPLLNDRTSVTGWGYWPRQVFTHLLRKRLFAKAITQGLTIVSDSCNLEQQARQAFLQQAKTNGYHTVLVWVHCPELVLLQRLRAADDARDKRNESPTWVRLYQNIQRLRFQQPSANEADELIDVLTQ